MNGVRDRLPINQMEFSFTPQTTSRKYGPEIPIPQQSDRSETIFPLFVCLFGFFFFFCCVVCVWNQSQAYMENP